MSQGTVALAAFLDREAAVAAVTAYAGALDARDWTAYRALLSDQITLDYGAIGSVVATIAADEWTARCRALEGFDATAHRLHNISAEIAGDRAVVRCIVDAAHFIAVDGETLLGDLIGHYTHLLVRDDQGGDGWKITGVTLTVAGYPAGRPAFDAAFAAARAKFAERAAP